MILVLCTVLALLTASSHAQDSSGTTFTSPCPGVFTYNPSESKPGLWSGVANLYSETLLLWVELSIVLDSPALGVFGKLEDWVRNATTHNNVKFTIDLDFQIYPDFPVTVLIFVQYDPKNKIPRLQTIRLNEKDICNADFKPDNKPSIALNPGPSLSTTPDTPITTYECGLVFGGNERLPLIYDGYFYGRGEIPWLVAIFRDVPGNLLFICGGTLVSDRHVVSAAHCMQRPLAKTPIKEILVKVGLHNLNDINDTSVVTRKLAASSIHEEYNPDTLQNDILIFTLEKSVKFTRYIRPACIWSGDTELSRVVGATGVVAGWGNRSERDTRGRLGEPQMVRIPIVSTKECRASKAVFHQLTYNTTLCAGDRNGAGPCRGDSGTGLYLLEEGRWRLRGVVSLSLQNTALTCDLNEYVVFTDTAQYLPWIRKILTEKDVETENRVTLESTACGLVAGGNDRVTLSMGKDNARGDVPWLVAIYVRNATTYSLRYLCAGTLVSDRHVVAAAHCMQRRSMETTETAIRDFVVKVGAHNVNDWTEDMTVTRKIVSIDINEKFKINPLHYDILVLTLSKRIQFNDFISPACLWSGNTELSGVVGSSGIIASWGVLRDDFTGLHDKPEVMRATIVSTEECRASDAIFGIIVSDTTFCAGNRDGATSCLTDGAGLFLLEGGRWRLRGIGALGLRLTIETSSCRQYAMYTDIAKFLPWITSILSQKYVD